MIGVPIARIRGIEIRVQLGWVVVVALVAALAVTQIADAAPTLGGPLQWLLGTAVGVGFFLSAMLHDLAHGLTAKRRGVAVPALVVSFFGGTTPLDPASPEPSDDLAIAASGPLLSTAVGAILAVLAVVVGTSGPLFVLAVGQVLAVLAVLNLMLGLVNLVPSYPLDGGRIVRAIVWRRRGSERAGWSAAGAIGRLTGFVVVAIGLGVLFTGEATDGAMVALSGWFLVLSSRGIQERVKVEALIGEAIVADVMERDPVTIHPTLTVDTIASQLLDPDSTTTAVPVVEGSTVEGIIGVRQVRRLRASDWGSTRIGTVMGRPPRMPILAPGDSLLAAVEALQRSGFDGVPVLDGADLVGVLTRRAVGLAVNARKAT